MRRLVAKFPVLRWIAVLPASSAAWFVALFVAMHLHSIVEGFCPPELVVSGQCTAPWYPTADRIVLCVAVALSAFVVVLAAAASAPTHKLNVARLALAVGAAIAAGMAIPDGRFWELGSAVVAGVGALLIVAAWVRREGRSGSGNVA